MRHHPFGNPAILTVRTRGFASPDCSGFALIGDVLVVNQVSQIQNRAFTQCMDNLYISGNVPASDFAAKTGLWTELSRCFSMISDSWAQQRDTQNSLRKVLVYSHILPYGQTLLTFCDDNRLLRQCS